MLCIYTGIIEPVYTNSCAEIFGYIDQETTLWRGITQVGFK